MNDKNPILPTDYRHFYGKLTDTYIANPTHFLWPEVPTVIEYDHSVVGLQQVKKIVYEFYKSQGFDKLVADFEIIMGHAIASIFFYVNSRSREANLAKSFSKYIKLR